MIKEGGTFLTERNAVASLAKLEAEVDALMTLERAVAGLVPGSPPLLALPLVFERKGLALEEKASDRPERSAPTPAGSRVLK